MKRNKTLTKNKLEIKKSSTSKAFLFIFLAVGFFYHQVIFNTGNFWDDYSNCTAPRMIFNSVSIANGTLPLWLSNMHCGFPNVDALTPHWTYFGVLPLSLFVTNNSLNSYWIKICMVGHVVMLGWFMFLFFRYHKLKYWAAVLGAITICLSGQFVFSQVWVCVVMGLCWLPLALIFADKFFESGKFKNLLWAGFFTGLVYLAGHSQWSVYAYLFISLYLFIKVIFSTFKNKKILYLKRFFLAMIVIFSVAFLTSSSRLLPEFELTSLSQKVAGNNWREGIEWKLLANTIFPHAFGKIDGPGVQDGAWKYWGMPGHFEGQVGFWHYFHIGDYAGVLPLILFFIAIFIPKKSKTLWALIIIEIGIVLFAFGVSNWFRVFVCTIFPPLKMFRCHFRMAAIFSSMILPMVFAFVFSRYLALTPEERISIFFSKKKKKVNAIIISSIVILASLIFYSLHKQAPGSIEKAIVTKDFFIFWFVFAAALLLFFLHIKKKINSSIFSIFFIFLILFDLYSSAGKFNCAKNSVEDINSPNQADNILINAKEKIGIQNQFRSAWNGHQANMKAVYLNVDSYNGYVSIHIDKHLKFKNFAKKHKMMDKLFDLYNIRFDINKAAKNQRLDDRSRTMLKRVYTIHDVKQADWDNILPLIFTNTFNPKTSAYVSEMIDVKPANPNNDKIFIEKYDATFRKIKVDMKTDGLLAFSEHNYPGWKARLDGQSTKIVDVNGIFMGVEVPAGEHDIEIYFAPKSVYLGMAISGFTWCFFGIFFIREKVKTKKLKK